MATQALDRELKKGSAELLILSLIERRARHGYEISKLIATRSEGTLTFQVASLYRLTPAGRKVLVAQRLGWQKFAEAVRRITGVEYA